MFLFNVHFNPCQFSRLSSFNLFIWLFGFVLEFSSWPNWSLILVTSSCLENLLKPYVFLLLFQLTPSQFSRLSCFNLILSLFGLLLEFSSLPNWSLISVASSCLENCYKPYVFRLLFHLNPSQFSCLSSFNLILSLFGLVLVFSLPNWSLVSVASSWPQNFRTLYAFFSFFTLTHLSLAASQVLTSFFNSFALF